MEVPLYQVWVVYGGYVFSYLEFIPGINPFWTYLGQYWELFNVTDLDNKNNSSIDYQPLEKKFGLPENSNDQFSLLGVSQFIDILKKK